MMYCLTRKKMKFNDVEIPKRTKGYIIERQKRLYTPDCHVQISFYIPFRELDNMKDVINLLEEKSDFKNYTETELCGYFFHSKTNEVYLGCDDGRYYDHRLSDWKVKKIFKDSIPERVKPLEEFNHSHLRKFYLKDVIEYLELQLESWVEENGDFKVLQKGDDELVFGPWEPGDRLLINTDNFNKEKLHYQRRLEKATGFTFDFTGGLIWE